jgi:hypothetical protein
VVTALQDINLDITLGEGAAADMTLAEAPQADSTLPAPQK